MSVTHDIRNIATNAPKRRERLENRKKERCWYHVVMALDVKEICYKNEGEYTFVK